MSAAYSLIHGVGFNNGKYPLKTKEDKRIYRVWYNVLIRCYDEKYLAKKPTYSGCTVSENFKSYSYFYEWYSNQKGFKNIDENGNSWHLDKDILLKGNKIYSEDTCVLVPSRVNILLTSCKGRRGLLPIGVSFDVAVNRFRSSCWQNGKNKNIGRYASKEEAFQAYKAFKEALIKDVANEYRAQLDQHTYNALMNYEVNEND